MSVMERIIRWVKAYQISISWTLVFALLVANSIIAYFNYQEMVEKNAVINRRQENLRLTQQLLIALDDAETGQRGFIITRRDEYLEPYRAGVSRLASILAELKNYGNVQSQLEMVELSQSVERKLEEMEVVLKKFRENGFEAAQKQILQDAGKKYMDDVRRIVGERSTRVQADLYQQLLDMQSSRYRATSMLIASTMMLFGMAVAAFVLVRKQNNYRSRMEHQLRVANSELEQRVATRTEALLSTNEKLQEEIEERKKSEQQTALFAEKLRASNKELELFATVASHDLQEPLRKIQAFSDRLVGKFREQLGETGRDYIDRIQNSASRMRTLIEDLLAYSRVSTKGKPFLPVDLQKVMNGVLGDLEIKLQETNATVEFDQLPTIEADELQMRQLFQNLIGNSLKFSRPNVPPVLRLAVRPITTESGEHYEITLKDNGIGFEQQYAERIFQLFQRLHGRSEYEGTGMGLAIAKKIVHRHQGKIEALGDPGVGSTFIIHLPALQPTIKED
jgi:signal transduction histidine kinase